MATMKKYAAEYNKERKQERINSAKDSIKKGYIDYEIGNAFHYGTGVIKALVKSELITIKEYDNLNDYNDQLYENYKNTIKRGIL